MKNVFDRFVIERKSLVPRYWSNRELKKFSSIFTGNVVNVSAWKDKDKQGKKYRDYFNNASEYYITNYKTSSRGHQGNIQNEIFLDLEKELDNKLINTFDVVFNHTVLEHIFKIEKAFENLCKLSKDIVIIVIPFLQEQHADYGDYWRMTPLAIKKMFKKNNMSTIYINYNDTSYSSIYIFAFTFIELVLVAFFSVILALQQKTLCFPSNRTEIFGILLTAVFATAFGFIIQSKAQSVISATKASLTYATEPVFAALLGCLILGEIFSVKETIGALFIFTGMFIAEKDLWYSIKPKLRYF